MMLLLLIIRQFVLHILHRILLRRLLLMRIVGLAEPLRCGERRRRNVMIRVGRGRFVVCVVVGVGVVCDA